MKLVFLGTSCMVPTKQRGQISTLLSYGSELLMFDCGEGTQRQLRMIGLKPTKISKILISHWHGDHVLGLPGLLQTISASEYNGTLRVFGPRGIRKRFAGMMDVFTFDCSIRIKVEEVREGTIFENKKYRIESLELRHRVPCLGYRFTEKDRRRINLGYTHSLGIPEGPVLGKLQRGQRVVWKGKEVDLGKATRIINGKKVAFIFDTLPVENCVKLAQDADVLVSEAVFGSELQNKALEYRHLTASQAGEIAKNANVKRLLLTHFSQRYRDVKSLKEEAGFDNVIMADDFTELQV